MEINQFGLLEKRLSDAHSRFELLIEESDAYVEYVVDYFRKCNCKVLSLDVFDTLVLRDNRCEAYRFLKMAELIAATHLQHTISPGIFYDDILIDDQISSIFLARALATKISYRAGAVLDGCREGNINEILRLQAGILGISSVSLKDLKCQEVQVEISSLCFNPIFSRICEEIHGIGGTVIALSDMYLDVESIEEIVHQCYGRTDMIDQFHSSANSIYSKASGRIFNSLQSNLGVLPKEILHIGDSFHSDFAQPKRNGWQALYFPISEKEKSMRTEDARRLKKIFQELDVDVEGFIK